MSNATELVDRALTDTGGNVGTYPRSLLLRMVNDTLQSMFDMLCQNPECGWGKHDETITVPAGDEEIDLIESLTYTPAEIRSIFHVRENGDEVPMATMRPGSYGAWKRPTDVDANVTPVYGERRPPVTASARIWNLVVLPAASGARSLHVYYRYVLDDLVETPSPTICPFDRRWDELIGKGAARKALTGKGLNEGGYDGDLRDLIASFLQAESRTIGGDVPQGTKEVVAPFIWDSL